MKKENDLGRDEIGALVWRTALPSMLAQFVSVLYSIVDRMYIGHIAGITGLAPTCDPTTPEELLQTFSLGGLREKFPDLVQIQWR